MTYYINFELWKLFFKPVCEITSEFILLLWQYTYNVSELFLQVCFLENTMRSPL